MSIQAITRAIPPILEEASSVTNGSDSISTTQDVVASATAMSSDTQATSKKASRIRKCWNRMTSVFRQTNNVLIKNVALIDNAVQNKTERLASDLVKIQGLVSLASGLKKSNLHSQKTISQYVRLNPIECMTVSKAEQFADYILKISQSNIDSTKKIVYFKMLLTDFDYPEGFTMRPEVYNVLPVFVKDELCCQVDALVSKYETATETDQTLVEIKAQGLSDQDFAVEFIHKLNQVTQVVVADHRMHYTRVSDQDFTVELMHKLNQVSQGAIADNRIHYTRVHENT